MHQTLVPGAQKAALGYLLVGPKSFLYYADSGRKIGKSLTLAQRANIM